MKKALTLFEMCIVLVVIGVVTTIGFNHYAGIRELDLDREVAPTFNMLALAERNFALEDPQQRFYPANALLGPLNVNSHALINTNLKTMISESPTSSWRYSIRSNNSLAVRIFCIRADRNGGNARFFSMRDTQTQPVLNQACP